MPNIGKFLLRSSDTLVVMLVAAGVFGYFGGRWGLITSFAVFICLTVLCLWTLKPRQGK